MIDVHPGDILVIGSAEYPVKAAAPWTGRGGATLAFRRQAKTAASTKRRDVALTGGKISAATEYLTGLKVTPLDPVSAELAASNGLETPHMLRQCFLGDTTGFLHLIVEDIRS